MAKNMQKTSKNRNKGGKGMTFNVFLKKQCFANLQILDELFFRIFFRILDELFFRIFFRIFIKIFFRIF